MHAVDKDLEDIARHVVAHFAPDAEPGLFDATAAALRGRAPKTARGGTHGSFSDSVLTLLNP